MVSKKDSFWRPCSNYRLLNTITVPERYPLPNLKGLSANMDGCTIFSKIDLVKAFHQSPVFKSQVCKLEGLSTTDFFCLNQ
jgi:hypothetical protein